LPNSFNQSLMKKHLITTLFIAAIVIFVSSCKSKHGTCAAYSQAPITKSVKHI
jgi:hypothetical protein